jgi:hypothetical protein
VWGDRSTNLHRAGVRQRAPRMHVVQLWRQSGLCVVPMAIEDNHAAVEQRHEPHRLLKLRLFHDAQVALELGRDHLSDLREHREREDEPRHMAGIAALPKVRSHLELFAHVVGLSVVRLPVCSGARLPRCHECWVVSIVFRRLDHVPLFAQKYVAVLGVEPSHLLLWKPHKVGPLQHVGVHLVEVCLPLLLQLGGGCVGDDFARG